jgi:hypothetical protein
LAVGIKTVGPGHRTCEGHAQNQRRGTDRFQHIFPAFLPCNSFNRAGQRRFDIFYSKTENSYQILQIMAQWLGAWHKADANDNPNG